VNCEIGYTGSQYVEGGIKKAPREKFVQTDEIE
jgi:hypothetical protein